MPPDRIDYEQAGFDKFLIRPLLDTGLASSSTQPQSLNFDNLELRGTNRVRFGRVIIDGENGRISYLGTDGVESTASGLVAPPNNSR